MDQAFYGFLGDVGETRPNVLAGRPYLSTILTAWQQLVSDPDWSGWPHDKHNPPWAFGERALVSTLAGAVWLTGGRCLEERKSKKWFGRGEPRVGDDDDYSGWRDLSIRAPSSMAADPPEAYAIEAKLHEPEVLRVSTRGARSKLTLAKRAARRNRETHTRIGLLFVVPRISARSADVARERGRSLREALWNDVQADFRVAVLPDESPRDPRHKTAYCPGVFLLGRVYPP
jgi:hypothetical protein